MASSTRKGHKPGVLALTGGFFERYKKHCMTSHPSLLFLSMGTAGISAAGVQLGSGLSAAQQLLGIGMTSLAVVLVNVAFDFVVFRERR